MRNDPGNFVGHPDRGSTGEELTATTLLPLAAEVERLTHMRHHLGMAVLKRHCAAMLAERSTPRLAAMTDDEFWAHAQAVLARYRRSRQFKEAA